jgi:threonine/homoserine/homoserine lactone efflux protein
MLPFAGGRLNVSHAFVPSELRRAARQGILSNLGNPKMLVFFTSLLPQYSSTFLGLAVLGLAFSLMTLVWLTGYAFATAQLTRLWSRPAAVRGIEGLSGACLLGIALLNWMDLSRGT